jgi:hypothetical protein
VACDDSNFEMAPNAGCVRERQIVAAVLSVL